MTVPLVLGTHVYLSIRKQSIWRVGVSVHLV